MSVSLKANTLQFERGMKRSQGVLRSFRASVGKLTGALGLAGGAAGLAFGLRSAVTSFASFEKAMAKVGSLLSLQEKKLIPGLTTSVQKMSLEFGQSSKVMAAALFDIKSAGIVTAGTMDVLRQASALSAAGFTDVKTAADALTTGLNAYGLAASEAARVSDVLFLTQRAGKTDLQQVAGVFGTIATLAATAGIRIEELGAALSTITRAGVPTTEAATAIAAISKLFIAPSPATKGVAGQIGIGIGPTGLEGSFADVLRTLAANQDKIAQFTNSNIRAIRGLLPLTRDLAGFERDLADQIRERGIVQREATLALKTTATDLGRLSEAWDQLKQSAAPAAKVFVQSARGVIMAATDFKNLFVETDEDRSARIAKAREFHATLFKFQQADRVGGGVFSQTKNIAVLERNARNAKLRRQARDFGLDPQAFLGRAKAGPSFGGTLAGRLGTDVRQPGVPLVPKDRLKGLARTMEFIGNQARIERVVREALAPIGAAVDRFFGIGRNLDEMFAARAALPATLDRRALLQLRLDDIGGGRPSFTQQRLATGVQAITRSDPIRNLVREQIETNVILRAIRDANKQVEELERKAVLQPF